MHAMQSFFHGRMNDFHQVTWCDIAKTLPCAYAFMRTPAKFLAHAKFLSSLQPDNCFRFKRNIRVFCSLQTAELRGAVVIKAEMVPTKTKTLQVMINLHNFRSDGLFAMN